MRLDPTTILVAGLLFITIGLYLWIASRLKKIDPKSALDDKILSKNEIDGLKKQAAAAYQASLEKELKQFEVGLNQLSRSMLDIFKKDVISANNIVNKTAMQLTDNLAKEYTDLLKQASSTIKANIIATDNELTEQTKQLAEDLKAIRLSRQEVAIKRVDSDIADILSQYLNAVLQELDLTDQEQFIMSKLESIKAPLLEDLKRGK